jgi:hypothetical protein
MAEGKRPGGLTALAVLNFVFGGISLLWTLLVGMATVFADKMVSTADKMGAKEGDLASAKSSVGIAYAYVALSLVSGALLIIAGVGYLGQKRFLGRTLGTVYAMASLGGTLLGVIGLSQGIGIFTIVLMVYPVLTLIMINTTFKEDLVN